MNRWSYFVAHVENGMITWDDSEEKRLQSLQGGLNYLGSQGWELVSALPKSSLGSTVSYTLMFKRILEAN